MKVKAAPHVSIIIPTYNRERFLPDAIDSLLDQTFEDFEIIIMDDGSTDHTEEIVKAYKDPRIQYHYIDHIGWISKVRNLGLKIASGKFIAFLDSDDIWLKDKLKLQVEILTKNKNSFILSEVSIHDSKEVKDIDYLLSITLGKKQSYSINAFYQLINNESAFYPSSILFPKEFLSSVEGFDESLSGSEVEFIGRMSYYFKSFYLPEKTTIIRKHQFNNSGTSHKENFKEKFLLLDKGLSMGIISQEQYKKGVLKHHFGYISLQDLTKKEFFRGVKDCYKGCNSLRDYSSLMKLIMRRFTK